MTYIALFAFIAILGSLGVALFFMMRGDRSGSDASKKMARALAMRVGLSIALFAIILISWKLGIIQPTGIAPGQ
jgi:hypothetical protein